MVFMRLNWCPGAPPWPAMSLAKPKSMIFRLSALSLFSA
jgi:hypothetical protein